MPLRERSIADARRQESVPEPEYELNHARDTSRGATDENAAGYAAGSAMMDRLGQLHDWLRNDLGYGAYDLTPASEDASFRRYYRVSRNGRTLIVMDAPPPQEQCGPYIDISARLLDCGVNVPAVRARDLEHGFLLLDDLGTDLYLDVLCETNADRLYGAAVDTILRMQSGARQDGLPPFAAELLHAEMCLFRDWLLERHLRLPADGATGAMLEECYSLLIRNALEQPQTFVHRDYHSRNLLAGTGAVPGVVDFQDAVCGPLTYDPVSLFKDCYIKWPRERVNGWALDYLRRATEQGLVRAGAEEFLRWFDLMGAQRQLKASGIFARLFHRDGKAAYLQDIPRTLSYIQDLYPQYPELGPLAELLREHVLPRLADGGPACGQ